MAQANMNEKYTIGFDSAHGEDKACAVIFKTENNQHELIAELHGEAAEYANWLHDQTLQFQQQLEVLQDGYQERLDLRDIEIQQQRASISSVTFDRDQLIEACERREGHIKKLDELLEQIQAFLKEPVPCGHLHFGSPVNRPLCLECKVSDERRAKLAAEIAEVLK